MTLSRRDFVQCSAWGAAMLTVLGPRSFERAKIKIGGCDWSLRLEGKLEAFALAKEAGLDGVQVSCGKGKDALPISDPEKQKQILAASKESGVAISSTCLEILHRDNLKEHADGPKWVAESIAPTAALGCKVILLPFFGKQAINKREEQKAVAERLKPIAPLAEKAGVVLGLEDTISAEDNVWIMDQVGSPAVQVYYDCGNSFNNKFDIYKEVAWLGKDRICELHLKDGKNLLGKGAIDYVKYIDIVVKTGFDKWALLETSIVTNAKDDFKANADYVRGLWPK